MEVEPDCHPHRDGGVLIREGDTAEPKQAFCHPPNLQGVTHLYDVINVSWSAVTGLRVTKLRMKGAIPTLWSLHCNRMRNDGVSMDLVAIHTVLEYFNCATRAHSGLCLIFIPTVVESIGICC